MFLTFVLGAAPASEKSRVMFQRLDERDGLSGETVTAVMHDRDGQIWLGTSSGLDRFDGQKIRPFGSVDGLGSGRSLRGVSVTALCEDDQGGIWIGTRAGGLRRLDANREHLITIDRVPHDSLFEYPGDAEAQANAEEARQRRFTEITALARDGEGKIWVGTRGGLLCFELSDQGEAPAMSVVIEGEWVRSLLRDEDGGMWIGTEAARLYRVESKQKNATRISRLPTAVTALARHHEKGLWVGMAGSGIVHFYRESNEGAWLQEALRRPSEGGSPIAGRSRDPEPLPREITALTTTGNGDLWAGTLRGVLHWHRQDGRVDLLKSDLHDRSSLAGDRVTTIVHDRGKMLWIGLRRNGVCRFDLGGKWFDRFRSRTEQGQSLTHASVRAFADAPHGELWIGTERGLNRWNPRRDSSIAFLAEETQGLDDDFITALLTDSSGNLWTGTRGGGLARYTDQKFRSYRQNGPAQSSLTSDSVSVLFESSRKQVWAGTQGGGLLRWDAATDSFESIAGVEGSVIEWAASELAFVNDIAEAGDDCLWVGSPDGLFLIDPEAKLVAPPKELWPEVSGIELGTVTALLSDRPANRLWVGTDGNGLVLLDTAKGRWRRFDRQSADLPTDVIAALALDRQRRLWVSAGEGLTMLSWKGAVPPVPAESPGTVEGGNELADFSVRRFSVGEGLQDGMFLPRAALIGEDGKLFFGGDGGFNRIDPNALPPRRRAPTPILTTLELLGLPVIPGRGGILESPLSVTETVELAEADSHRLSIRFSAFDFMVTDQPAFRYRLNGLEQEWNLAGEERRATYTGLEPGKYVFEVQCSVDGIKWNETGTAAINLVVKSAWYATWWARVGGVLLSSFLLALLFKLLMRGRAAAISRRRERMEMQCSRAEAALARQLQGAMLVQRTGREFRGDGDGGRAFDTTAQELGKHFEVARCQVAKLSDGGASVKSGLHADVIAEWTVEGVRSAKQLRVPCEGIPLIESALAFHSAVSSDDIVSDTSLGDWRSDLVEAEVTSLLLVRTHYMGRTNGLLLLHHCGDRRRWKNDEKQILETVADQFGIAIAQLDLSVKEERQRREIEAAREAAEVASRAKSDFLAKMTHELRTPLNAILGFSEMIKKDGGLSPTVSDHIDVINSSGEHLLSVINDVLDMSRIESGKAELRCEHFEPQPMVRSAYDMMSIAAEAKGIDFQIDIRNPLPEQIDSDKGKLRQVMINLLGNAIKFTQKGWVKLSIDVEALEPDAKPNQDGPPKVRLWFEVRDTGAGISEEELPAVFEKFAQTESGRGAKEGSGLGLSIARNFVEMMGGELTVKSKVGVGTAFTFFVEVFDTSSLMQNANGADDGQVAGDSKQGGSFAAVEGLEEGHPEVRVLVAEDQPVNRLLLRKILGKAGFAMIEAEDGLQAVEKWRECDPHIILMDEDMPHLRGSEAAQKITQLAGEKRPPIVSLTAFALDEQRTKALEAGCIDFLSKPFKADELFAVIARHVDLRYRYAKSPDQGDDKAAA